VVPIIRNRIQVGSDDVKQSVEMDVLPWPEPMQFDFGGLGLNKRANLETVFGLACNIAKEIAVTTELYLVHQVQLR